MNTSIINISYKVNLRSISKDAEIIIASFYASRSYIRGNINWLRGDLVAAGALLLCIHLLVSPALFPHIMTSAGYLAPEVPSIVIKILRQFSPMTKGHESYSTCGGTESFADVIKCLVSLRNSVKDILSNRKVNMFDYYVVGLSSEDCYFAQMSKMDALLGNYIKSATPEILVRKLLTTLAALKQFKHDEFKFEILDSSMLSAVSSPQVGYGIRKFVRVSPQYISFNGEASPFHISLFCLLVENTSAVIGHDTHVVLNSPIVGGNIAVVAQQPIGEWFLSTLSSYMSSAVHGNLVPQNDVKVRGGDPRPRGKSFNLGRHASETPPGGRRPFHTSPASGHHADKLYKYDGNDLVFLGYLKRE